MTTDKFYSWINLSGYLITLPDHVQYPFIWCLDRVITRSLSVKISYFLGLHLFLMVPLHHLGLFVLSESGLCSYRTLVPTSNLANSLPLLLHAIFEHFSDYFSISSSVDFLWMSIMGRPVLNFLPFKISLGLLFTPGMSVAPNMSMASQVSSVFLIIICFMVWTILSTLPTDWWLYALDFSMDTLNFAWNSLNSWDLKQGPLSVSTLLGRLKSQ